MMNNPPGETRGQRERLTKQALADVTYQTTVSRRSGISRSHLLAGRQMLLILPIH